MAHNRRFGAKQSVFGEDTKEHDLKAFGLTTGKYLFWDGSADTLYLIGTFAQTGAQTISSTLTVTGLSSLNGGIAVVTDKFTVSAAGAVVAASTVKSTGNFTVGDSKFVVTAATGKVDIAFTSASTHASNSVDSFVLATTMTGPAGVGGRARFALDTNVALGGWANALKAVTTFGATGRITGMASAFCGELVLSAGTTQGTYAPIESELSMATGASLGTATSFFYGDVGGTGAGEIIDGAYLFELGPSCTIDTNHVVQASAKSAINSTHAVRIRVAGTTLYFPAHTSAAFGIG